MNCISELSSISQEDNVKCSKYMNRNKHRQLKENMIYDDVLL